MDIRIAAGLSHRQKRKEEQAPQGGTAPEREGAAGGPWRVARVAATKMGEGNPPPVAPSDIRKALSSPSSLL